MGDKGARCQRRWRRTPEHLARRGSQGPLPVLGVILSPCSKGAEGMFRLAHGAPYFPILLVSLFMSSSSATKPSPKRMAQLLDRDVVLSGPVVVSPLWRPEVNT